MQDLLEEKEHDGRLKLKAAGNSGKSKNAGKSNGTTVTMATTTTASATTATTTVASQKSETTPKSAKKFQKASEKASQSSKSNAEVPTDDTNDVKKRSEVQNASTDDGNAQDIIQDATEVKQSPPQSPQATSPTEIKRPKRSSSFHNMSTRLVLFACIMFVYQFHFQCVPGMILNGCTKGSSSQKLKDTS